MSAEGKAIPFQRSAIKKVCMERSVFESRIHKEDQQFQQEKPASACAYSFLNNISRCGKLKSHQGRFKLQLTDKEITMALKAHCKVSSQHWKN